tara:strand:+ start:725 stop:1576 length:852 start_codon:yes stop_codon:yes gene_type:complete
MKTTMNNFLIFGDSYSDEHDSPYPSVEENDEWQKKNSYRWPMRLKKEFSEFYTFRNFSLQGSSPYFSLNNLMQNIHNLKKNDIILFFISDFDRIDFACEVTEIKKHLTNIFYSKRTMKADLIVDETFENERLLRAFFLLNESEIDFFYKTFFNILHPSILREIIIGFLKTLSNEKQCKIIVFDKNVPETNITNTENFYIYGKSLGIISKKEYPDYEIEVKDVMIKDDRVNHMSPQNHEVMLNLIKKIIKNEEIEYINFHKKIIKMNPKNIILTSNSSRDFIYE